MKSAKDILKEQKSLFEEKGKYITKEYQDYGYRLALRLNDLSHKSLYIKIAKEENRTLIENALSFSLDYPKAKSKAKIFMWKLKELKDKRSEESKDSEPEK